MAKRKNGHNLDCRCHICENIKNKAKRGGYEKEAEIESENIKGGSKKKNGHRIKCNCPICINMKNAKNKTRKKGGTSQKLETNSKESIDFITNNEIIKVIGGRRNYKKKTKKVKTRKH
jgi:hypothetical protein